MPASGFALYLDRLMDLIKPEVIAPASQKRILVRVLSGDAVKEAFKAADSLRRAGYIAEFDMDGQAARWTLEVRRQAPLFTLVDSKKSGKYRARTFSDVLKLLEAEGVAKNSPA